MSKKAKPWSVLLTVLLALTLLGACVDAGPAEPAGEEPDPASAAASSAAADFAKAPAPAKRPAPANTPAAEPDPTQVPAGEFSIRFLDVGQADAALITCDGKHMLIDGGNREDSSLLYSLLEKENITHLDYVVGTHPHEDHIGGIPGALERAAADVVLSPVTDYDSKAFANFKSAADANGGLIVPNAGDVYSLGSAHFSIVGANADPSSANNSSIVLRLMYGDTSFLFTGDAEREAEQVILNSGCALRSDVLKVGHHGSDTSTTYPFLREVMPQYAVISCGADNPYGHPDKGVLSRLRDAQVQVFRTDLQGDILCTSDGTTLTWEVEKNANVGTTPTARPTSPPTAAPGRHEASEKPATAPAPAPAMAGSVGSYIGSIHTKKVHRPFCSSLPHEKNRVYFDNLNNALNQGYVKCKRCF